MLALVSWSLETGTIFRTEISTKVWTYISVTCHYPTSVKPLSENINT